MRDRVSLFNLVRKLLHTSITQSVWLVAVTLTAPLLAAGGGRAAAHPADLTVRVNMTFDRSLGSKALQVAAQKEATAIWSDYGVALEWTATRLRSRSDACWRTNWDTCFSAARIGIQV